MTDAELVALHRARDKANAILGEYHVPIADLFEDQLRVDRASLEFRRLGREIVAELNRRGGTPVVAERLMIRLTRDRLSYSVCDPETGLPFVSKNESKRFKHAFF